MMDFGIKGQVAVVTGGSRGIGKAIVQSFLEEGVTVVIGSRTQEQIDETVKEFSEIGSIHGFVLDVGSRQSVQEFVEKTINQCDKIDTLVNCAGINLRLPADNYPEEDWERIININLNGAYRMSQEVGKKMIERQSGNIINITSLMSHTVTSNQGPYAASKAGLAQYTRLLAVEWAKHNIRVNAVSPGYIETDLTKGAFAVPEYRDKLLSKTPQQRFGKPEDIADSVVFLASKRAAFINGHILAVDGGFLAGHPDVLAPNA
ncbi:SDR family oxidoreductase [bacterium LRH843]|nr:SDR family oxidoreductase [bacterium LRH843]